MIEVKTTLRELYARCLMGECLKIGDGRIEASSMRYAIGTNFRMLLDLDLTTEIAISTVYDHNPDDKREHVFLGDVIHEGHDNYAPAWLVKKA